MKKLIVLFVVLFLFLSVAYAADPVYVDLPRGIWTKAATNVTAGNIGLTSGRSTMCNSTYKMTGGAAPTSAADGVPVFELVSKITISASAGIDIYFYCVNADGRVSVDL